MDIYGIYDVLSHQFRRKILMLLDKEGYIPYTELMEKLGLEATGQLNFHLKKLENLIDKDNKSYYLTEEGKRVLRIMNINNRILSGDEIEHFDSKGSEINRVGVIICDCNTEISKEINISALENYISKLKNVVSVKIFENLCQEKYSDKIIKWVKENFLNKIVIAACSPKTHAHIFERIFQDALEHANVEIANIREQCAWVHHSSVKTMDPNDVLKKAQLLIEAAVERVVLQKSVKVKRVDVEKSCAILGGGIAGMTLALNLSRAGIKVFLIDKSPTLGGKVARWHRIYKMGDCSICFVSEIIGEIAAEKNIKVFTNSEIENVSGEVGNFTIDLIKKPRFVDEKKCTGCKKCIEICSVEKPNLYEFGMKNRKLIYFPFDNAFPYSAIIDEDDVKICRQCEVCTKACATKAIDLDQKPEKIRIKVGTKVIAIGASLLETSELDKYGYNPKKDVITSPEFERMLSSDGYTEGEVLKISNNKPPKSISIIQCVGASDQHCEFNDFVALKYLNCIKVKHPLCKVDVFYEINKMPENKDFLLSPMDPRFHYANELKITENDGSKIVFADGKEFPSDLIVLNIGLVPNKDLKALRKKMDFTLDDNGFMSEETLASGIYGAGTILGPSDYHSTIASANKVAIKIISLLSQDHLIAEFSGTEVNEEKCGLCGLCAKSCPYNAITIEAEKINVDKFKCKGCGTCVSVCPTNAIEMNIDTTEKIIKSIEIFSRSKKHPKIMAFCCKSCGYAAADDAGLKKIFYNPNIFIIRVPCTGRVDTSFILKSFELGFDGVMVIGCRKDACRFIDGVQKVEKKIRMLKTLLGPKFSNRIVLKNLNAVEGSKFADSVNKFYAQLQEEIKFEA